MRTFDSGRIAQTAKERIGFAQRCTKMPPEQSMKSKNERKVSERRNDSLKISMSMLKTAPV